ncbi:PTS sugar transporter subunit IIB [Allocoprobacillus halotolerans]|uniref:PTS sugar transporter subunit IIB n=1 Tax=Allocoprobacillus halotolerans TaxID=2944914 RepID=A0ABY5I4U8_9FIRM|nr:PTS sugar transporter subunit IIB [Allocoprobacillus halotolerans]UTY39073.1 PTS sugar transporter subunit IIB [Allocoprobacillus halotolerans]
MKILLVCNAGMSTSMLVSRMEKAAKAKGIDATILAVPLTKAEVEINEWDVVMLGPQVRHCLNQLKKCSTNTPIEIIDMRDYGLMNGEKVLDKAIQIINQK